MLESYLGYHFGPSLFVLGTRWIVVHRIRNRWVFQDFAALVFVHICSSFGFLPYIGGVVLGLTSYILCVKKRVQLEGASDSWFAFACLGAAILLAFGFSKSAIMAFAVSVAVRMLLVWKMEKTFVCWRYEGQTLPPGVEGPPPPDFTRGQAVYTRKVYIHPIIDNLVSRLCNWNADVTVRVPPAPDRRRRGPRPIEEAASEERGGGGDDESDKDGGSSGVSGESVSSGVVSPPTVPSDGKTVEGGGVGTSGSSSDAGTSGSLIGLQGTALSTTNTQASISGSEGDGSKDKDLNTVRKALLDSMPRASGRAVLAALESASQPTLHKFKQEHSVVIPWLQTYVRRTGEESITQIVGGLQGMTKLTTVNPKLKEEGMDLLALVDGIEQEWKYGEHNGYVEDYEEEEDTVEREYEDEPGENLESGFVPGSGDVDKRRERERVGKSRVDSDEYFDDDGHLRKASRAPKRQRQRENQKERQAASAAYQAQQTARQHYRQLQDRGEVPDWAEDDEEPTDMSWLTQEAARHGYRLECVADRTVRLESAQPNSPIMACAQRACAPVRGRQKGFSGTCWFSNGCAFTRGHVTQRAGGPEMVEIGVGESEKDRTYYPVKFVESFPVPGGDTIDKYIPHQKHQGQFQSLVAEPFGNQDQQVWFMGYSDTDPQLVRMASCGWAKPNGEHRATTHPGWSAGPCLRGSNQALTRSVCGDHTGGGQPNRFNPFTAETCDWIAAGNRPVLQKHEEVVPADLQFMESAKEKGKDEKIVSVLDQLVKRMDKWEASKNEAPPTEVPVAKGKGQKTVTFNPTVEVKEIPKKKKPGKKARQKLQELRKENESLKAQLAKAPSSSTVLKSGN
jgi:type II secretory pathway pseudopilin PulG